MEAPLNIKKLNLGCGDDYRPGWWNVDAHAKHVDQRVDLNILPLPWDDNQWDEIACMQVMEHLDCNEFSFGHECIRILKPGGYITFGLPSFSCTLYHKRFYHPFHYLNSLCGDQAGQNHNADFCPQVARFVSGEQKFNLKLFLHRIYELCRAMGSRDLIKTYQKIKKE